MKVRAFLKNYRVSPRKARLLTMFVKGLPVSEAIAQLDRSVKRSGLQIKKLVSSALANAENTFGLDRKNLYVFDVRVDEGPTLKRWMPRAFGRATEIHKRTSRITVVLDELVEGLGRKTKQQIAAEKRKLSGKKKAGVAKKRSVSSKPDDRGLPESKGKRSGGGFAQKRFQRKSV